MFKFNNKNTRERCEICSKSTIKIAEQQWHLYGVFIDNFEHLLLLSTCFIKSQKWFCCNKTNYTSIMWPESWRCALSSSFVLHTIGKNYDFMGEHVHPITLDYDLRKLLHAKKKVNSTDSESCWLSYQDSSEWLERQSSGGVL